MNNPKELHENELAAWLAKLNTSVEPYSKLIAVVVFAAIAAAIGWGLYNSKVSGDRSDATLQLLMKDPEVAEKYPDTPAAAWSLLYAGNDDLESGIASLYLNRQDAETMLSQARDSFNDAMKSSDDRLLRSRAHLGLAMVSESLGELDEAIESYREVIKLGESDAMVAKAKARAEELGSPDTKEFVTWFEKQDFTPADPSLPPELSAGTTLPEMPDLKLPTLGSDDNDSDEDAMQLEDKSGLEMPPEPPATESAEATTDKEVAAEEVSDKETATEETAAEESAAEETKEEK